MAPEATALVVGGGIAGVTAALVLAERGVQVELLEAAPHLGGRLGTWDRRLADGSEVVVEHGYHGFFRQYYTLRDILRRLDPELGFLRDVGGYPIASRPSVGWEPEDFTALPRTPLLNLVALVLRSPSFKLRELRHVNADEALAMLHYDPVADLRRARPPQRRRAARLARLLRPRPGDALRGVRALVLQRRAALLGGRVPGDVPLLLHRPTPRASAWTPRPRTTAPALWEPFTRLLEKHGATVTHGARAVALRPDGAHGWAVDVEGEPARHARHLVVTTDVPATRDLVAASPELVAAAPGLARRVAALPERRALRRGAAVLRGRRRPGARGVHRRHPRARSSTR